MSGQLRCPDHGTFMRKSPESRTQFCASPGCEVVRSTDPEIDRVMTSESYAERFWRRVDRTGGPDACWYWTLKLTHQGYPTFIVGPDGKYAAAHRVAYALGHDGMPVGLTVDHECHNRDVSCPPGRCAHRRCCNPAHLVARTSVDNRRAASLLPRRSENCRRGHPFTPENTYWARGGTTRVCRACRRAKDRSVYASKRPPSNLDSLLVERAS